jgi:hypothetical protein
MKCNLKLIKNNSFIHTCHPAKLNNKGSVRLFPVGKIRFRISDLRFVILFLLVLFLVNCKPVSANALINEFSVQPEDKNDWIEIYSPDNLDISGWKVADSSGDFETIPQGTVIGPSIYYVVSQYQRLNNQNDTIYLKNPQNEIQDHISYGGAGQVCVPFATGSIARIPDGGNVFDRVSTPTKGSSNNSAVLDPCPSPTPVPTSAPTNTPNPTCTPTPTNTATPTLAPTSTPKPTPTPTKKPTPPPMDNSAQNELLKNSTDVSQFRYSSDEAKSDVEGVLGASNEGSQNENISPFAYVLFGLGIIFVSVSIYLFIKNRKPVNKQL